jgi:hypothetical protein
VFNNALHGSAFDLQQIHRAVFMRGNVRANGDAYAETNSGAGFISRPTKIVTRNCSEDCVRSFGNAGSGHEGAEGVFHFQENLGRGVEH